MTERRPRVLLVDDDPITSELFSLLLEPNGLELVAAATPAEARHAVRFNRPELILLDLNLGSADGLALTSELRRDLGPALPLVAVSASSDSATQQRALAAGATGFIPKPVHPRTFPNEVKQYLSITKEKVETAELDPRERRLRELREQFIATALASIEQLTKRNDEELLSDTFVADAAHKWVGASSIEGMPDVEGPAREIETLARAKRSDQVAYIRQQLQWLHAQFCVSRLIVTET